MALTIQERLKDLRVERGLTLEQLAEQTHLSKSALGSYEAEDFKDISHYALITVSYTHLAGSISPPVCSSRRSISPNRQEPLKPRWAILPRSIPERRKRKPSPC